MSGVATWILNTELNLLVCRRERRSAAVILPPGYRFMSNGFVDAASFSEEREDDRREEPAGQETREDREVPG
jgi:hypothetical protein